MRFLILAAILTSAGSAAAGPLAEASAPTLGERLASCLERSVKAIDRMDVPHASSYTKHNKHSIPFAVNSVFVYYKKDKDMIIVTYVKGSDIEGTPTSAENAKKLLQSLDSILIKPASRLCASLIGSPAKYKYIMTYVTPAHGDQRMTQVVTMNENGQFMLP